jgi:hypothetical protein
MFFSQTRKDFCRSALTALGVVVWDGLSSQHSTQAVSAEQVTNIGLSTFSEGTIIYTVEHLTTYKYKNPVTFGKHRAIFLPNSGHGQKLLQSSLDTNIPAKIHWLMDTLSNNIAEIQFSEPSQELVINCRLKLESRGIEPLQEYVLDNRALEIPIPNFSQTE